MWLFIHAGLKLRHANKTGPGSYVTNYFSPIDTTQMDMCKYIMSIDYGSLTEQK